MAAVNGWVFERVAGVSGQVKVTSPGGESATFNAADWTQMVADVSAQEDPLAAVEVAELHGGKSLEARYYQRLKGAT